jgi:hypothetical protein
MLDGLKRLLQNNRAFAAIMVLLFCATLGVAFYEVLPANVVFLAPDAPLQFPTFREALHQLLTPAPAVLRFTAGKRQRSFWLMPMPT